MIKALLVILVLCAISLANKNEDITFSWDFGDSSYRIVSIIPVTAEKSKILFVLSDFKSIQHYSKSFALSLTPLESSSKGSTILYTYNYLIAKIKIWMSSEIDPESGMYTYWMSDYHRTSRILPIIHSLKGSYTIVSGGTTPYILYQQEGVFGSKMTGLYRRHIKKDIEDNIKRFRSYLHTSTDASSE